jgi:Tol biopolymer transport system component
LFLVPAAGGASRPLALHDSPGASLTLPMFAADGRAVYYSATPYTTGPAATSAQPRIQRISTDGGAPATVVESATSPAPAADGRMLAYLQVSNRGDALWLANVDGSDGHEVVPASRFLGLAYPRIAPDGRQIAFAATLDLPSVPTPGTPRAPFAWRPAREAHGLPWDVWLVNLDGSGLRRLTYLVEDDPSLAWSPDGHWLAIQGGFGLTLVDASSGRTERLSREQSFGAIDWARD